MINNALLRMSAQGGQPRMAEAMAKGYQQGNALADNQYQQQQRNALSQIAQAHAQGGPEAARQVAGQLGHFDALQNLDKTIYGRSRDQIGDQFRQEGRDYSRGRDQIGDARWQQTFDATQDYRNRTIGSKAPQVKTVKLSDGSESAVQWDQTSQEWVPINAPQGGGTVRPRGKLTAPEQKLVLFQSMQDETQPVLVEMERSFDPANVPDAAARLLPGGNFWQSPQGQQYSVAAAAWGEGALRIATGAAATQPEIERTVATYFAQPGDDPSTVKFKQQMRGMYSRAIQRGLGYNDVTGKLETPLEFAAKISSGNASQSDQSKPESSKIINGVQYEKHNGKWFVRQ